MELWSCSLGGGDVGLYTSPCPTLQVETCSYVIYRLNIKILNLIFNNKTWLMLWNWLQLKNLVLFLNPQLQPNLRPIRGLYYLRLRIWEEIKRDHALGLACDIISNCGNVVFKVLLVGLSRNVTNFNRWNWRSPCGWGSSPSHVISANINMINRHLSIVKSFLS